MNKLSYYNFDFNQQTSDCFTILQDEIRLIEPIQSIHQTKFKNETIQYNIICKNIKKFTNYVAILPIKDDIELLKYTFNKLEEFSVFNYIDFIVVDDRPKDKSIENFVISKKLSYISIHNNKGFNFSILNNVAALVAKNNGAKNIILWNSDLWPDNDSTIPTIIKKFETSKVSAAGTKLLYPDKSITVDGKSFFDLNNINMNFPQKIDTFYNSVQYGGSNFIFNTELDSYIPIHSYRFRQKDDMVVNIDKPELFITGAFQIINLQDFIDVGGLNPSLSKNFQDVEFCFKLLDKNKKILYFGENTHLIHAESVTLTKHNKYDFQMTSDFVLFSKLCGKHYLKFIN